MKAIVFERRESVGVASVADPKIVDARDVIIKVERAAICGSDLHPYFEREKGLDPGTVMGHEGVGTIVEVGRDVKSFEKGDRVFAPFTTNCGKCYYCRAGLTCRCVEGQLFGWVEKGKGLHGLQAEYARVPLGESTLMKVPEGVRDDEALLLGDVMSTGYFCAERAGIDARGVYVVVGSGPVGLMAVLGAKDLGAQTVFALDPVAERRALAARYGATALAPEKAAEAILNATDGRGADAVMDAVGSQEAARLAFELIRPGGTISTVGVSVAPHLSFSASEAYNKNVTYRSGRCPARHYMERLIPLVQSRKYDLAPMLSHRLPLAEAPRGYRIFADRAEGCTKVILTP